MPVNRPSEQLLQSFLKHIRSFSEDKVRDLVVRPYLESIGATFISCPSGTNERGKDLYYFIVNMYGEKELHCCQVKNKPFNAQASSNSSLQTAINQINQSFISTIINPEDAQHELPRFVTFINTYDLPDRGLENTSGYLEQLRQRSSFICGRKFAEQVYLRANHVFSRFHLDLTNLWNRLCVVPSRNENRAFGLNDLKSEEIPYVGINLLESSTLNKLDWRSGRVLLDLKGCVVPSFGLRTLQAKIKLICTRKTVGSPFINNGIATTDLINKSAKSKDKSIQEVLGRSFSNNIVELVNSLHGVDRLEFGSGALKTLADLTVLLGDEGVTQDNSLAEEFLKKLESSSASISAIVDCESHICLTGPAGAGKSSTAREIAKLAAKKGKRCLYFPCHLVTSSTSSLREAIICYIQQQSHDMDVDRALEVLNLAELVILDGADEASTIDGRFSSDLCDLVSKSPKVPINSKITDLSISHLNDCSDNAIRVTTERGGKQTLELNRPLTQFQLETLALGAQGMSIESEVKSLIAKSKTTTRYIVTSRPNFKLGIEGSAICLGLQPLTDKQLKEFFQCWCSAYQKPVQGLIEFLAANSHIRDVCRAPITATILVAIYLSDADLPRSKSELYQKRFDLLLEDWDHIRVVPRRNQVSKTIKHRYLGALAYKLHIGHRRLASLREAVSIWDHSFARTYPKVSANAVIKELCDSNGVLEQDGNELSFGHMSFQEYMAALHIVITQKYTQISRQLANPRWRNVAIFFAGITGKPELLVESALHETGLHDHNSIISDMIAEANDSPESLLLKKLVGDLADEEDEDGFSIGRYGLIDD